jgi:hypothetical protein
MENIPTNNPRHTLRRWSTVAEFVAHHDLPSPNPSATAAHSRATDTKGWTGARDWHTARNLAVHGWPDGLAQVAEAKKLVKIPTALHAPQIVPRFSEEGDEVSVDRYLANEPDHWLDFPVQPTPQRGRICRVILSACASASFAPEQLIRRGAVAAALIDALESAGVRCEVSTIATMSVEEPAEDGQARGFGVPQSENYIASDAIILKRPEDPLDLERLVFWLAHPSALRRMFFRSLEDRDPGTFAYFRSNYGKPADLPPPPDSIMIGSMFSTSGAETQLDRAIAAAAAWIEAA